MKKILLTVAFFMLVFAPAAFAINVQSSLSAYDYQTGGDVSEFTKEIGLILTMNVDEWPANTRPAYVLVDLKNFAYPLHGVQGTSFKGEAVFLKPFVDRGIETATHFLLTSTFSGTQKIFIGRYTVSGYKNMKISNGYIINFPVHVYDVDYSEITKFAVSQEIAFNKTKACVGNVGIK